MTEKFISEQPNIEMACSDTEMYGRVAGLSLQKLFIAQTHKFPSAYFFTQDGRSRSVFNVPEVVKYLVETTPKDENIEVIQYITENLDTKKRNYSCSIVFHKSELYFRIEEGVSESYILFHSDHIAELEALVEKMTKFYVEPEEEDLGNFFTLSQDNSGFHLLKQKVNSVNDFDIELQYNDDFIEADDILRDFLEYKNKSGIVFLHGDKGTGKTTYIRQLINDYPELKFVSIPPSLVGCLAQPSFTQFMHNNLHNTIIILEDCESVIKSRETMGSDGGGVDTLLNIGDGLLSDDLGIKFICTFNYANMIDEALTRKGRLAVKYEFKNLVAEKVKTLIPIVVENKIANYREEIGHLRDDMMSTKTEKDERRISDKIARIEKKIAELEAIPEYTSNKPMSLADIFNIDEKTFEKEKVTIGF